MPSPSSTLVAAVLMLTATGARAQVGADLNISPKRLTLGGAERSATVYLFNQGGEPATYTVEMVDRAMTPNGEIVAVGSHAARPAASAADLLQYTPHRVTLLARQSQSIRIRVSRPQAPGEYRSHLTVTALPPEEMGLTAAEAAAEPASGNLAVKVVALFSISIPVIVREGPVSATVSIQNAHIEPRGAAGGAPSVVFDLVRNGDASVYGDVEVLRRRGREEKRLALIRGVAVYPEIEQRTFMADLSEVVRPGDLLRVVYRDDDKLPGKELATASLVAP